MLTSIQQSLGQLNRTGFALKYRKLLLPVLLAVLLFNQDTRALTLGVLADAFWAVAVFVAATLTLYHAIANRLGSVSTRYSHLLESSMRQVVFASIMGAIPGCGGAIIVMTQYVAGRMRFGAVVAVLTSTMGDAAFLLIASQPSIGLSVIVLSVLVGIISGLVVNRIHSNDFLRCNARLPQLQCSETLDNSEKIQVKRLQLQSIVWQVILVPSFIISLMMAAQWDVAASLNMTDVQLELLGAALLLVLITLWSLSTEISDFRSLVGEDEKVASDRLLQKVALDTNFITSWVILAFLSFELLMFYTAFDLLSVFNSYSAWLPMIGVVIGMSPGCGPQILTTSLYLSGNIPLSAQLGNAISNDGDALFPALALAPKVAVLATLYSAVPAILVAYGYYWLFE